MKNYIFSIFGKTHNIIHFYTFNIAKTKMLKINKTKKLYFEYYDEKENVCKISLIGEKKKQLLKTIKIINNMEKEINNIYIKYVPEIEKCEKIINEGL